MKKVTPNGQLIRDLREQLEYGSLQKEMAFATGMSERKLRMIERQNTPITIKTLKQLAKHLNVPADAIAYAIDTPKLVPSPGDDPTSLLPDFTKERLIPRHDKDLASVTMDEGQVFVDAKNSHDLTIQIETPLDAETTEYVQELTDLLTPLTWNARNILDDIEAAKELGIRRRLRQLLILLKGNDVWVYQTHQTRRLPERFTVAPKDEPCHYQNRLVLAFGPPGEYGEDSMLVEVDNGQPFVLEPWNFAKRTEG